MPSLPPFVGMLLVYYSGWTEQLLYIYAVFKTLGVIGLPLVDDILSTDGKQVNKERESGKYK